MERDFCYLTLAGATAKSSMSDHLSLDVARSPVPEASSDEAAVDGLVPRRESRMATNWIAMIRLFDGTEIPCNVKDISKSGAKLGVPSTWELPTAFMLKVVGRDFVMRVSLAWRRGNYAGVHIDRIAKLPPPVDSAGPVEAVKSDYDSIGTRSRRFHGD